MKSPVFYSVFYTCNIFQGLLTCKQKLSQHAPIFVSKLIQNVSKIDVESKLILRLMFVYTLLDIFKIYGPNLTSFWESKWLQNRSKIVLGAQGPSKKLQEACIGLQEASKVSPERL